MDLELRHLRLVKRVAEEGTLTAAAKRLYLTQSALSQQLADLERRVGTAVFHRVGRRMVPTLAGVRVLEAAELCLPRLQELEVDLSRIAREVTGLLRITTECYTSYRWLPEVLPLFRERHPAVEVILQPDAAARHVDALLDGTVDLALAYSVIDDPRIRSEPLWEDDLVMICAPDHPYASLPFVTAEHFADQQLLVYRDDPEDSLFYQAVLRPAGVAPRRVSEIRLTEGIVAMVAAGVGVAVLTRWTVAADIRARRVRMVRVTESGLKRRWHALFLDQQQPPGYLTAFIEQMRTGPIRLFEREKRLDALGLARL
jgi:LysR family transcriptional regulator, regulator for metE and metH